MYAVPDAQAATPPQDPEEGGEGEATGEEMGEAELGLLGVGVLLGEALDDKGDEDGGAGDEAGGAGDEDGGSEADEECDGVDGVDDPEHPPMQVCMFANCEPGYSRWFWVVSKVPNTPAATPTRLSAPFLSEESS